MKKQHPLEQALLLIKDIQNRLLEASKPNYNQAADYAFCQLTDLKAILYKHRPSLRKYNGPKN